MRQYDYESIVPIVAPNGRQLDECGAMVATGRAAITYICEYPEVFARWMDFFYTDEGGSMIWAGVEGESYTIDDNGELFFLDENGNIVPKDKENDIRMYNTIQPGGRNPGLSPKLRNNLDRELNPIKDPNVPFIYQPIPSMYFSEADIKSASTILADIEPYVQQFVAGIITGNMNIDSEWDSYITTLEQMGVDELVKLYNSSYAIYESH